MKCSCGELDADGGLGLEAELVARESREDVGLADAGVADQDAPPYLRAAVRGRNEPPSPVARRPVGWMRLRLCGCGAWWMRTRVEG